MVTLKGKHLIGADLQFQRFHPLLLWWGHCIMHAGMVLKELRVLHLDLQVAGETMCHTRHSLSIGDCKSHHSDTYSNKATPPNSATPYGDHFISNQHSTTAVPEPFSKPFCLFAFNRKCYAETRAWHTWTSSYLFLTGFERAFLLLFFFFKNNFCLIAWTWLLMPLYVYIKHMTIPPT